MCSVLRSHGEGTLCLHTRGVWGPRSSCPGLGTLTAHRALPTVGSLARHAKQWCQNVVRLPGREAGGEGGHGAWILRSSTGRLLGATGRGSAGQPAGLRSPQRCVHPGWGGTRAVAERLGGWVRTPSQSIWSLSAGPFLSQGFLRPSVCVRASHFPERDSRARLGTRFHASLHSCPPGRCTRHGTCHPPDRGQVCFSDALKKQDVRW